MGSADFRNVSADFEVRGEIQGLHYLEYCKEEASKLGVFGWVKHTKRGTIVGMIQGQKPKVATMVYWLTNKGSPGSRIDSCYMSRYRYIPRPEYRSFTVRI